MTKDEIIEDQRQQIATLREEKAVVLRLLQGLLDKQELRRQGDADRQYRKRHPDEKSRGSSRDDHADSHADRHSDSHDGGAFRGGNVLALEGGTENGPQNQEDGEKNTGESAERGSGGQSVDTDWLSFRETYPKTDRTSWGKAERRWKALSKADRGSALVGCRTLAAQNPEPRYRKAADGWLTDRRWETVDDWQPPMNGNGNGPHEPAGYAGLREYAARQAAAAQIIEGETA